MSKVKNKNTQSIVIIETVLPVVSEVKQLGRPVNKDSVRQKRLAEIESRRVNGELKRGRPVDEASVRQVRLKELEDKRLNGELKRGRPTVKNSVRQIRLAEMKARAEMNGGIIKRGRPAKTAEIAAEVLLEVVA